MMYRHFLRFLSVFGLLALLGVGLTACAESDAVYSDTDPPMVEPEDIPVLNPQTETWRPGYWALQDGTFVWVPGMILSRPSPTAIWSPARWNRHVYGWAFEPGHWQ